MLTLSLSEINGRRDQTEVVVLTRVCDLELCPVAPLEA